MAYGMRYVVGKVEGLTGQDVVVGRTCLWRQNVSLGGRFYLL